MSVGSRVRTGAIGVTQMFERQAELTPDRVAVTFDEATVSYADLDARASHLAHHLRARGVGPEAVVGVALDRSIDLVVALLGVLKAGAAYVPLDLAFPRKRLRFMVEDARVGLVIADDEGAFEGAPCEILRLASLPPRTAEVAALPSAAFSGSSLAYVIFTSGSTGRPKAVQVEHRALANLLESMRREPGLDERDVLFAITSLSFDIAALEIFLPLVVGARLALTSADVRDGIEMARALAASGATVMQATPTAWQLLLAAGWKGNPNLRILCGGEPLSRKLASQLLERSAALWNMYGPTETTIWSTCAKITSASDVISIGRPIDNTQTYVVEQGAEVSRGALVRAGEMGELWIGGGGVARGYLDQPGLTREKFVPDPFSSVAGARLYRTGDLARELPDGRLELFGRVDRQVKVRGVRIDLGEIESVLTEQPGVQDAVVLGRPGPNGAQQLVAYVVARPEGGRATAALTTDDWRRVWSEVYRTASADDGRSGAAAGWNDSATGLPMDAAEVRDWADRTAERVLALKPRRVLEIGCGSGLLLRRVAPHCERYVGIDITTEAVEHLRRALAAEPGAWSHVDVRQGSAEDVESLAIDEIDLVIVNSVLQYFPDVEYARRALAGALTKVAPGGFVFVGDVRNLDLLEAFHASVAVARAPRDLPTADLAQKIREGLEHENELVVAPAFFHAFAHESPRVEGIEVSLKRGRRTSELTRFRYDVILRVGGSTSAAPTRSSERTSWQDVRGTDALARLLAGRQGASLLVEAIPNARVGLELGILSALREADAPPSVSALLEEVRSHLGSPVEPETVAEVGEGLGYQVQLSCRGGAPGVFDATFLPRDAAAGFAVAQQRPELEPGAAHGPHANDPSRAVKEHRLARRLRRSLAERLPAGMIPSRIVIVGGLPRTPGGKLDAMALAALDGTKNARGVAAVRPRDPIEERVAAIWREVLDLEDIGVEDDFFDLGGDSLLAVEVMDRTAASFGQELSLAAMFGTRGLTIARQAAALHQRTWSSPNGVALVPLRESGRHPPLFFATTPMNLPPHIDAEHPFYELTLSVVHTSVYVPEQVDATVTECVRAIRAVQPKGPYYLGGLCFGALVMLDVALRLAADNEEVGLLALFDPDPEDEGPLRSQVVQHLRELRGLTLPEKTASLRRKTGPLLEKLKRVFFGAPATTVAYESLHRTKWAGAEWKQAFPTALFLSEPRYAPDATRAKYVRFWKDRARELTVVELPGNRLSAFVEPNVRVAGAQLNRCLEVARSSRR